MKGYLLVDLTFVVHKTYTSAEKKTELDGLMTRVFEWLRFKAVVYKERQSASVE